MSADRPPPRRHDHVAEDLADLAISLHDDPTVEETVDRVLAYALKAVSCELAGVVFVHGRRRIETEAVTDPRRRLELVQIEAARLTRRDRRPL